MSRRLGLILLLLSLLPALSVAPVHANPVGAGRITGIVTDLKTGAPLPGIRVALYYCYRTYHVECSDLSETTTDAAGRYVFDDADASADGLTFSDPTGAYLEQEAEGFRLPEPGETLAYDAALQRYDRVYGGISGRLTAKSTGEPLGGWYVKVLGPHNADHPYYAYTEADGTYQIDWVGAGRRKVQFGAIGNAGRYAGQFYGDVYTEEAATEVEVVAGEVTAGIDGALEENGRIAGTIRSAATGAPLAGAWVRICDFYVDFCSDIR